MEGVHTKAGKTPMRTTSTHLHVDWCVYVCVYIYMYIHIYIYTYMYSFFGIQ